jgi:hypothetical protein
VVETHLCTRRDDGTHDPMGICIYIFVKHFMTLMIYMMDTLIMHVFMFFFFMIYDVYCYLLTNE